ncbi:aspartate/glutamate racemase family protein [Actinomadura sp. NPDC048955]|uniref:aspartate/glutamate racemase family protein n=1 Tax=Actinomadura sp. NPDC048955 TaxID=3158228 RepID=UPI003407BA15
MDTGKRRILHVLPVAVPPHAWQGFAEQFPAGILDGDTEVEFTAPARGPANMIDSDYERTISDVAVLAAVESVLAAAENAERDFAAIVVNSMSDSGLLALRSRVAIPVVGAGQASLTLASCLGSRIGVVTMWRPWHALYSSAAAAAGISERLVSVRDIGIRPDAEELLGDRETVYPRLLDACSKAIQEDGADVLILGSTTMHPAHQFLAEQLDVPLINPGVAAQQLAQQLVRARLTHSRRAHPAPARPDSGLLAALTART